MTLLLICWYGEFGGRGELTAWDVDIDRHDAITAANHRVTVVVVTTTVRATSHGDDASRVGHLIVHLTQGRGHIVGQGTGDEHDIGLTGGGTENDTQAILIVAGGGKVHHLDGAAGETECHGPKGRLTSPVGDLIESRPRRSMLATGLGKVGVSFHGGWWEVCRGRQDVQDILRRALLGLMG